MSVIKVTVAPGFVVRAPNGAKVPDSFSVEENDPYWSVKLRRREILPVSSTATKAEPTSAAPAAAVLATPAASSDAGKAKS